MKLTHGPTSGRSEDNREGVAGRRADDATMLDRKPIGAALSLVLALITLVAFVMRVWRIDFQSLWWDEGVSIYLAGTGVPALTYAKDFTIDLHPPLYHLTLALWRLLFGPTVFSMRMLSAFAGVLTIPLVARVATSIARDDARKRVGILAALVASVSPIAVYYSQESRMYPFLPLLGALSLFATIRVIRRGRGSDWVFWGAANLISWYLYYYFAFWSLALSFGLFAWCVGKPGERATRIRRWLIAQVVLLLGYAPWLVLLDRRLGRAATIPIATAVHLTPWSYLSEIVADFTLGFDAPPQSTALIVGWLVLLVLGAVLLARRQPGLFVVVALTGLLPIAGAGGILLFRPFFFPRFVLFVILPIWLLVAIALGEVRRNWLPALLVLPLLAGSLWTWHFERVTPRVASSSDDYLTVFAALAPRASAGDVVLCDYPWQAGYVDAYLGKLDVHPVYLRATSAAELASIATSGARTWVFSYDPTNHFAFDATEKKLIAQLPVRFVDRFGDSQVALYGTPSRSASAPRSAPRATFADGIDLQSARLSASALSPGDTLALTLDWQSYAAPTIGYKVFVHLLGPNGKVVAQHDGPPLSGAYPTNSWSADTELIDRYALTVPAQAPPGDYQVEVGLYSPTTGVRLKAQSGSDHDNRILLGTVKVGR